ncbi:MAG: hypothetical protein OEV42_02910 [Deltaproteobacteria bacterium]|nr:hypothetical protein [Deltaproteobacteria bacterium]
MKELKYIIELLYSHFLLRDLAGKVVPGAVILFTTVITLDCFSYIDLFKSKLQFVVWILLLTFSWIIGLAAQAIGSHIRIVRYSVKYSPTCEFHEVLRKFRNSKKDDKDDQRLERFMAIGEAYGNGAAATIVAYLLWLVLFYVINKDKWMLFNLGNNYNYYFPENILVITIIAIVSFISLLLGHRETIDHQDEFISTVINEDNSEKADNNSLERDA